MLIIENKTDNHEVAVFTSFFIIPALYLFIRKESIFNSRIDRGFVIGIGTYMIFLLWLVPYYPGNENFFLSFKLELLSTNFILWNVSTFMVVASVDFFTKRIIQYESSLSLNEKNGFLIQCIVWFMGHIPEYFWLRELMGIGALFFIIVSGIITGLVYMKYKNVLGLMIGHWLINFIVAVWVSV